MKFKKVVTLVCPPVQLIYRSGFFRAMAIVALVGTRLQRRYLCVNTKKKVCRKISQNSHRETTVPEPHFTKVEDIRDSTILKRDYGTGVFL